MQIINRFQVILDYEVVVDESTGEITSRLVNKSIDKNNVSKSSPTKETKKKSSKKVNEVSEPQLTLEDNKYCLNDAAIQFMQLTPDDKLDVKYEKYGNKMRPIIGTDEAFNTKGGNKLTKSNTVACRGSKNEELSKYGSVFSIKPHESKEGLFILIGDKTPTELMGDENVSIKETEEDLPLDIDLSALIDEGDNTIEEIDASYFQL